MADRVSHAKGWFLKGESDLKAASAVVDGEGPYDTACFHAQQAAEKFLKGLLAYLGETFPATHNLEELEAICRDSLPEWKLSGVDLTILTPYAVEMRYDLQFWPDRETAVQAIDLSQQVRAAVLSVVPEEAHPT